MMTGGPRARVGDILPVEFTRPRDRRSVIEHPYYYDLRGYLMGFLEGHDPERDDEDRIIDLPLGEDDTVRHSGEAFAEQLVKTASG